MVVRQTDTSVLVPIQRHVLDLRQLQLGHQLDEFVDGNGSRAVCVRREEHNLKGRWGEVDSVRQSRVRSLPYHVQCLLELLKVDGSALVHIKIVKGILAFSQSRNAHLPSPHLVQKRLELLELQLPAT